MLRFLAFFGNSEINFELFRSIRNRGVDFRLDWLNALTNSKIVFNKAMATLRNYSLVEYSPQGYSLHACVHDWTLQALNQKIEMEYYWDAMMCIACNVKSVNERDYWQNNQPLVQHAAQLWRIHFQLPLVGNCFDVHQTYSLCWVGHLWSQRGNHKEAALLFSTALDAYEKTRGIFDKKTLQVILDLADTYKNMDRLIEAEEMYLRALGRYKKALMADEKLLQRIHHNLARLYRRQGNTAKAEQLLRETLGVGEVSFGFEDIWTLQILNSLAQVLCERERFAEAETLAQRAIEGLSKVVDPHHPITLSALETHARAHFNQNQFEQAEPIYHMLLEGRMGVQGPDNMATLKAVQMVGKVYAKQQKLDELVKLVEFWGSKEVRIYLQLGKLYLRQGNNVKAAITFGQALQEHNADFAWLDCECDGCHRPGDVMTAAMGRFLCLDCVDTDLCRSCYEQYQAGRILLDGCVGHSFMELPTVPLAQA